MSKHHERHAHAAVDRFTGPQSAMYRAVRTPAEGYALLAYALWGPEAAPPEWMADAACRGTDPDMWHANRPTPAQRRQRELLCVGCPVMQQCAEYQERTEELPPWLMHEHTYAAGETHRERRQRTTPTRQSA